MRRLTQVTKRFTISSIVFVQIFFYPVAAFAQTVDSSTDTGSSPSTDTSQTTSDPAPDTSPTQQAAPAAPAPAAPTAPAAPANTGPTQPTGSSAPTYTYNDKTGMWENGTYAWDPVTKQTKPLTPQTYSYNPATGMWDTTEYVYHPETGTYQPNVKSVTKPPAGASVSPSSLSAAANDPLISNTGPNSTNTISNNGTYNGAFDLFFNAAISNTLNAAANSGNALVQGNTNAGSALSGDARSIANVLNMIQSSWASQGDIASFIANIDGSYFGDLLLDPNQLSYANGLPPNANIDINVANNGAINNDINLTAGSGNATVDSNTNAGDAQSGDAHALADILNMINSSITADRSFIGMININGNFDGDILLPLGMLDKALIANTGPDSSNTIDQNQTNNLDVSLDKNRTINNTINADATSGAATTAGNTSAGDAATGKTTTNVNTLNLVGQNVTGKNALLVFVNVMGSWLGFFINPGTTNNIDTTGPNSTNSISSNGTRNISLSGTENSLINNNINVSAASGDAAVTNNTSGGNARSGDATADVNLLNLIDSNIDVSDWFGVLFINVFGDWLGSFGTNTPHGNVQNSATTSGGVGGGSHAQSQQANVSPETLAQMRRFFTSFTSSNNTSGPDSGANAASVEGIAAGVAQPSGEASKTAKPQPQNDVSPVNTTKQQIWVFSAVASGAVLLFLLIDNRYILISRFRP